MRISFRLETPGRASVELRQIRSLHIIDYRNRNSITEGRFTRIGIPYPDVMGPFAGVVETLCGLLIIVGLLTRLATIPLMIVMVVAVISTKAPILLGHDVGPFELFDQDIGPFRLAADIKRVGFWSAQHEARADLTMFLALLFLLIVGAGRWSFDAATSARAGRLGASGER
jgi:uncharacterized membrane protein YphA (DoxX/SURF4 family)